MEATAYGIRKDGSIKQKVKANSEEGREIKNLIRISESRQPQRHGVDVEGKPLPYIGYVGGSNYCIEIVRNEKGKWEGEVISTFEAYQLARQHGPERLRHPTLSSSGKPLIMRLVIGDYIKANFKGELRLLTVKKIKSNGGIFIAAHQEANVRQREDTKDGSLVYGSFSAGSLFKAQGRPVAISPIGELRDSGFKE